MHVFVHALNARLGGGQTYLYNLLHHAPGDDALMVTVFLPASAQITQFPPNVRVRKGSRWLEHPLMRALWERTVFPAMLRREDPDILFFPGGVITARFPESCRVVTMFRNMLPFDMRQRRRYSRGYRRLRNWLLERIMLSSMRRADLVIFISEYARKVLEPRLSAGEVKGVVIPHGINDRFREPSSSRSKPSWVPQGDYLLYVSSIDVYKMQVEVVRAFARLSPVNRGLTLVLAGPDINPDYSKRVHAEIARHGLQSAVRVLGSVHYDRLPALYQHAMVNIFASECENCPNILLEMLASGRPVVCSSYPPMPEFGGDAVVYFDPENPDELARALDSLLRDASMRKEMGRLALERSRRYRWSESASKTWREMLSLADDKNACLT